MHIQFFVACLSLAGLVFATPHQPRPSSGTTSRQCKRLPTDPDWPAEAAWKAAMPNVVARGPQGNITRPDYSLVALSVADVQAAVNFTRTHNIRLTILNSGHDFLGRNDAPTGLSLMVGSLKGAKVLTSFTPSAQGAESPDYRADAILTANKITPVPGKQAAVTFGAGVTTQELHDALAPSGLFTMGAAHGSVATAGGWAQNAGHGPLSSAYGLGVDQVLEYKVVTADGQLRVANARANPDLFWALRGGGGGTFGVVVESTVKAFPTPKITTTRFWINATELGSGRIFDAAAYIHSQYPEVNAKGMQGYYYIQENSMSATFLSTGEHSGIAKANATWAPIFQTLANMTGITAPITSFLEYNTMKHFFDFGFGALPPRTPATTPTPGMPDMPDMGGHAHGGEATEDAGGHAHGEPAPAQTTTPAQVPTPAATTVAAGDHGHDDTASGDHGHGQRDLPHHHGPRSSEPESLRAFFKRHGPGGMMEINGKRPMDSRLLGATHLKDPRLAAALKASFPRMKHGILRGHLIAGGAVLKRVDRETSVHPAWRQAYVHLIGTGAEVPSIKPIIDLSPDSGSYSNEASYSEPNWKSTQFGPHYPRLLAIKTRYDPTGLFWVTPGIGADQWSVQSGRLCPATGPSLLAGVEVPPANDNPNMRNPETERWSSGAWPANQTRADVGTAQAVQAAAAQWAAWLNGTTVVVPPVVQPSVVQPTAPGAQPTVPAVGGHGHEGGGTEMGGHDH